MREPIDLHETSPGNWEPRRHFEKPDGRIDFNKLKPEDIAVLRAQNRKPRRLPTEDNGLGLLVWIVVIVILFSIFG
jgi:hypothetical protein